jgi:pimeloyl-ACP methyl ester carboxylesterase
MNGPTEAFFDLSAGRFRVLRWEGQGRPAVLLHGLTAVADVWEPTVAAISAARRPCWALDQRGHGESPAPAAGYAVRDFAGDLIGFLEAAGLQRPHLVGHSMGARVALVAAARRPELFASVTLVDIGPEAWRANWRDTVAAIDRMPRRFSEAEALAFLTRNRPTPPDRGRLLLKRVRPDGNGVFTWRGDPEAWKQSVINHRARNYWRDWDRLRVPALLVRGGTSNELRPHVAAEMRRRNPAVWYEEFEGIGHNIPLLAPDRLAASLTTLWRSGGE